MKKLMVMFMAVAVMVTLAATAFAADTLAEVKKKGVLVVGVKDSTKPFGFVDEKTRQIVGYDIDFVNYIAKKLGVKIEVKAVTSATRMPQLKEGNIDMIAATMTKNPERAKEIDFSYTYFLTGQKFIVTKGKVKSLKDLEGKKIGTTKGSTSEKNAAKALPTATILSFDDYPQAFLAMQQGKVQAVTTDEAILAGILGKLNPAERKKYEIASFQISEEPYGLGMRKGDVALVDFVNKTLLEMEKKGDAKKIFEKWFGAKTETPLKRTFTITADTKGLQ